MPLKKKVNTKHEYKGMSKRLLSNKILTSSPTGSTTKNHYQTGQLSITGIHATVLSILIAFLTAYAFHVYNVIQDMELKVIDTAARINNIPFIRYSYLPPNDFSLPKDKEERTHIIIHIIKLLSSFPHDGQTSYEIPEDPADRAEKAMQLMNVIAHRYPFPEGLWKTDGGWNQERPHQIVFGNINDVVSWLIDLNEILRVTTFFRSMPDTFLSRNYLRYFEALEKKKEALIQQARKDPFLPFMGTIKPRVIFGNFINGLNKAEIVALETEYKLNKMNKYTETHLSRNKVLFTILTTGIVFFLSVIVPVVFRGANRIFWVYVPSVYYVIIFIYIVKEVIR